MIQKHDFCRPTVNQLAAQLRSDRAAGPAHQDHAPRIGFCDFGRVQINLIAAEQVLRPHCFQLTNARFIHQHIDIGWHDPHIDPRCATVANQLFLTLNATLRQRYNHTLDAAFLHFRNHAARA